MSTRIICHSAFALLCCILLYACNSQPTGTEEKITLIPLDKKSDTTKPMQQENHGSLPSVISSSTFFSRLFSLQERRENVAHRMTRNFLILYFYEYCSAQDKPFHGCLSIKTHLFIPIWPK